MILAQLLCQNLSDALHLLPEPDLSAINKAIAENKGGEARLASFLIYRLDSRESVRALPAPPEPDRR